MTVIMLSKGDGPNDVYAEYRTAVNGSYTYSLPSAAATIILNSNGPGANVNSPAGVFDTYPPAGPPGFAQQQVLNSDNAQWITYSGSSSVETAILNPGECLPSLTCTPLLPDDGTSANSWIWLPPDTTYTWTNVTATDQSGRYFSTGLPSGATTGVFKLFSPGPTGAGAYAETCYAAGTTPSGANPVQCTILADAQDPDRDLPGDMPSQPTTRCTQTGSRPYYPPIAFSGYSDPSMRAESLVTSSNPFGTNLWMLYSHPQYWSTGTPGQSNCSNTGVVEVHLAESDTSAGAVPGGTAWAAVGTIWPTESYNAAACTNFPGYTCYSSHEVSNFWVDVDSVNNTESWYAAHLMYWVKQGHTIDSSQTANGCLVMSVAAGTPGSPASPTSLGWTSGGPPDCSTPSNFPPNNTPLYFTTLTTLVNNALGAGLACNNWGEPAIMVGAAPAGYTGINPQAVYLAALCIPVAPAVTSKYYIFFSQDFAHLLDASWIFYSGPFGYDTLPPGSYPSSTDQPVNSITELDWAVRADNSIVAVVTPQYVVQPPHSTMPYQYGCAAVNFDLLNGWTKLIATVSDIDGTSASLPYELEGPNGCTYEPRSSQGVVTVRHLLGNSQNSNFAQNQFYSLIDTGVLP